MRNHGKRLDRLETLWRRMDDADARRIAEEVAADLGVDVDGAMASVEWVIALGPVSDDQFADTLARDVAAEFGRPVERVRAELEQIMREQPQR